jgi:hypothetical protein
MDEVRAGIIAPLKHHAAFRELADDLAEAEAKYWKRFASRIKSGEVIDQREVDFMRGKFEAVRVIVKQPERAARHLERVNENKEPDLDGV